MIEYSKIITEKWTLSQALAEKICRAYERGDTPFYLNEYSPQVILEMDISKIWEIYDYFSDMEELSAKKKRTVNALNKAGKLSPVLERQISLSTKSYELDDLLVPLRPNPRSKGQVALKKGLEPLADLIAQQKEERRPVEDIASEYVGKDPSLKSVEDVLQGAKDLLAERFAYDETVRAMSREFLCDDGFFEIVPKNKKDPTFSSYIGKNLPISEISKEEQLRLFAAENSKAIKIKLGVQLFRITELLRHHFIENPDSISFDIICEIIDDMWQRLLHPVAERDIKEKLKKEALHWADKEIFSDLRKTFHQNQKRGAFFIIDSSPRKNILIAAVSGRGDLLGATSEKTAANSSQSASEKLRQFYNRHKPEQIVIVENGAVEQAETIFKNLFSGSETAPQTVKLKPDRRKANPSESKWMKQQFAFLEPDTRQLYGMAIAYLKPISLIPQLGCSYYNLHALQDVIAEERFVELVNRIFAEEKLKKGVSSKDVTDSPLNQMKCVNADLLQAIKDSETAGQISTKNDLLKVKGMTETAFRNISGFIVIVSSENLLDKSTVHPDYFPVIEDIGDQLNVSLETIISDPEIIKSYVIDEAVIKTYLESKLIPQLKIAQGFSVQTAPRMKRKLKLSELKEGVVVSGRVTNVTPFGVFVNINAVCDGLIHISQLADEFVETPDQVVSVGEKVDVRILKVDVKKRRISLSMKNLGAKAPKIRPSKGQLDNLADFFKNR